LNLSASVLDGDCKRSLFFRLLQWTLSFSVRPPNNISDADYINRNTANPTNYSGFIRQTSTWINATITTRPIREKNSTISD
jgi:hypothetical protein